MWFQTNISDDSNRNNMIIQVLWYGVSNKPKKKSYKNVKNDIDYLM